MAYAYRSRRRFRRISPAGERILLLSIVIFMSIIAFYAFKNYLMTGSFGLVAAVSATQNRISTGLKGIKTFFGSLFGMLLDGYAGFTNAVVSAAFHGNWAAMVFLSGYAALVFVLLWNYFDTGKFVR